MTIRIEKPKSLKDLVALTYTKSTTEVLSPAACTLLSQVGEDVSVESYQPTKSYHKRTLSNTGSGGSDDTYLVDSNELMARINRVSTSRNVTFIKQKGVLTMNTNYVKTAEGYKKKGVVSLREYGGPIDDFQRIDRSSEVQIATISAKRFIDFLSISSFGDFSDKSEGSSLGRTVSVSISGGKMKGLTNYKGARMSYYQTEISITQHTEDAFEFGIEGSQLKRVQSVVDPDDLEDQKVVLLTHKDGGYDWLTFSGKNGFSSLRTEDVSLRYQQDRELFNTSSKKISPYSKRGLSLASIQQATKMMKPSSTDSNQEILFTDEGFIKCSQVSSIGEENWSSADVIVSISSGDWEPIIVNSPAIEQSLKTIAAHLKSISATDSCIVFEQKYIQKKSNKTWILYLDPCFQTSDISVKGCMVVKEAEKHLDMLDIDE